MRILITLLLLALPCLPKDHDKPKGKGHGNKNQPAVQVYFQPADLVIINRNYSAKPLPPGLQKKLARQGTLPPGWQKRYRPFPAQVEAQLPPLCNTCARGYYDNYTVVFDKRTAIIYDIAQLTVDILRP